MIQSWNFTNFAPNLYIICIFFDITKKLGSDLESLHFLTFSAKRRKIQNLGEMFMENLEMVIEKSWKNILSSLWEPCLVSKAHIQGKRNHGFHTHPPCPCLLLLLLLNKTLQRGNAHNCTRFHRNPSFSESQVYPYVWCRARSPPPPPFP